MKWEIFGSNKHKAGFFTTFQSLSYAFPKFTQPKQFSFEMPETAFP